MSQGDNSLLYFNHKEFSPRFGDNFYTVQVQGHSLAGLPSACGGQYALYHLQVKRGRVSWVVKRRFSEFDNMQLELRRLHPDIADSFPALPPKTCFRTTDETFLDDRGGLLASYVESLLTIFTNKRILQAEAETLFDFLNMNEYSVLSLDKRG